nr:DEAD/DEAH box helicase family protein [Labrenzia sp. R5_0]
MKELIADYRTSIAEDAVDSRAYRQTIQHLRGYTYWDGAEGTPHLWEHQKAAISTVVAYLNGNKTIPERPEQKEAALLKLPTGTGKSGIVAVLTRCLPDVRRVLVLTPRTALTEQLIADVRYRFWGHMGFEIDSKALFTGVSDIMGQALEEVYVEHLLPSNASQILQNLEDADVDRSVLVGTHQALSFIRKAALNPDDANSEVCQNLLELIRNNFDFVVVDEGHYEPAISWSRGVREFNLPTLLLSATPYRNDYKSFRVRGRYLFNFPYAESVERKIIRPVEIIVPAGNSAQNRQAAVTQFVGILRDELPDRLDQARHWFRDGTEPKVMVRGDDLETLKALQQEINQVFETHAVLIHDRAKKTPDNQDRFTSVASAKFNRPDATFWIHQNKLMEGIDDPSFVAVGIFDFMGNARQLVQQIGRVTRHSKGDRRYKQTGWVLGSPSNAARIQTAWKRYKGYEDYAARNTTHIVNNEVTLPDRLLEYMAEYQYISGEFRGRFEIERPLAAGDIQLPRTAAVLRTAEPLADIGEFGNVIEEAIMDKDRFKITPVADMPANAMGFSYYAWRNSPYLIDRFFSEWKLGIFIAVQHGDFVFMHDTEGLVVDIAGLKLKRAGRSLMEKAFPDEDEANSSRLSRMSFSSLDMSQHAIRGMAMRTRSFADVFTDLLDPSLVPATASGFVNGSARYIGFARSRLRDASEGYVPIAEYIDWTAEVVRELDDGDRSRSRVFDRYATVVEDVDPDDAQPVSILLDPSLDDMRDDEIGGAAFVLHEDINYFDLCADVDEADGSFVIEIDDQEYHCSVEFIQETGKYRVESDALNARFPTPAREDRRQGQTLVQRLNQRQAFRILTNLEGVIYSEGSFYEPRIRWVLEDGSKPILGNVFASPSLDPVDSEKGENYFAPNRQVWHRRSIFGVFSACCEGQRDAAGIAEDELTRAIEDIPIWLCDDDGQEVADFIGIDPALKKFVLVHAKVGSQGPNGRGFNVGGLQVVGRQALASLGFISIGRPSPVWTSERWRDDVQANAATLNGRNRMFSRPAGMTADDLNDALHSACRNSSYDKEIWIVGAQMARRETLEDGLDQNPHQNRLRQFLMHWDAMQTACARANARLKFFCSD